MAVRVGFERSLSCLWPWRGRVGRAEADRTTSVLELALALLGVRCCDPREIIFSQLVDLPDATFRLSMIGRPLHRSDDHLIAGAPTKIAFESDSDFPVCGMRILVEKTRRRHDHPGSAVAALEAVFLPEPFLHGAESIERTLDSLNGLDRRTIGLDCEDRATLRRFAVEQDGACTTVGRVAPDVRAGQPQLFAEEMDEEIPRLDVS